MRRVKPGSAWPRYSLRALIDSPSWSAVLASTLGWAAEFAEEGIAANTLWPESLIATAAVRNLLGGDAAMARARTPEVVADAAMLVLAESARDFTGNSLIDVDVLAKAGHSDLSRYGTGTDLELDIFIDPRAE